MEPRLTDALPTDGPNYRRHDAARYLRDTYGIQVQPSTMAKWFCTKSDGPRAFVAGRFPLHPKAELDRWATQKLGPLRSSTSDAGQPIAA
jgi:hypothetical protein